MKLLDPIKRVLAAAVAAMPDPDRAVPAVRVLEAAGVNTYSEDEAGWTRLSASGGSGSNSRDLTPLSQDHMQRAAEFLWQSNVLGNRLVEVPLAYLLAEGVTLQCEDEDHQKLLHRFWLDPINNWPLKLPGRVRDLALMGEQCYQTFVNEADGFVRLGYVDPRTISQVVLDPDNPEQPIGVLTKKDMRGNYKKFRVLVLGPDEELFSRRTVEIRKTFNSGDVFLFQVNKLATGTRGRSDLLHLIDWIDAYDGFLFGELDRTGYLRAFVWDLNVKNATPQEVAARAATFKPPQPNSAFVHNDGEELQPKTAGLQAADTSEAARLFRNHVLAGATVPEHWIGGGGDVNRAAAAEMGEPTFKVLTARQSQLKLMLEAISKFVLASQPGVKPDWEDKAWKVTAVFPELVNKDVTKFAAALQSVVAAVISLVDKGLLTEEKALALVGDVAGRFGQTIDPKAEIEAARKERAMRKAEGDGEDTFTTPGAVDDEGDDGSQGTGAPAGAKAAAAANGSPQP